MAWANVQRVEPIVSPANTTGTCTISAATAGNLLVSACATDKDSGGITIPTGWTRIGTDYQQTNVSFSYAYKIAAGGETSIAWSWVNSKVASLWAAEYSGLTSTPLDQNQRNSSVDTAVQTLSTGTTGTTAQADELAIALMASDTAANTETGRSWTNSFSEVNYSTTSTSARPGLSVAEKRLAAAATVETTFATTDTGDQMVCVVATFKESSATSAARAAILISAAATAGA